MAKSAKRYFLTGGAGFVGTNLTERLLSEGCERVTVYDDFSVGRKAHVERFADDKRLVVHEAKLEDMTALEAAIEGHDVVYHFASNADIAAAVREPDIDFRLGTLLTQNVLEAMRKKNVPKIVFTSGSGVYGDVPREPIPEAYPHMIPVSTYGACKLASEALISAYSAMFGIKGIVFRMGNVIGRYQTHGVGFDFLRRMYRDKTFLEILGDGKQTKPYIHVKDVINAYRLIEEKHDEGYACFNLATDDHATVTEIAEMTRNLLGLSDVEYQYTGGDRGWKGDVPYYKLDCSRIHAQGWKPTMTTTEALQKSLEDMLGDLKAGLFE